MRVEQFVMAYGVEHDRLRAILPEGFVSLRPVLRLNAEVQDGSTGYVEFNTAVAHEGKRGWLNIGFWENVPFTREGGTVTFETDFLRLSFTGAGVEGGCPAEKDNDGCFFLGESTVLRPPEPVTVNKEFCDCSFAWRFQEGDAQGVSIGMTLPAIPEESAVVYPKQDFTPKTAAAIPCRQVLGSYVVRFLRTPKA